jgi:hypothetical protein
VEYRVRGKKETIASFDNGIDGIPRKNPFGPKGKPPNKGAMTSLTGASDQL